MTDLSYMIWLLATAAMTITVLTVGTLAAAELLPTRRRGRRRDRGDSNTPDREHQTARPLRKELP